MNRPLSLAVILTATLAAHADGPGLSLRVNDEAAPPGSVIQIKVDVTEPKPISTGRGRIRVRGVRLGTIAVQAESSSGLTINDVVLMNDGQDTYGVATIDGDELTFDVVSPSSAFGTPSDTPILGIRATMPSSGSSLVLGIDPSGFRDPSGATYPYEVRDGVLTVSSGAISIGDVTPGAGVVPAGSVVRITGTNFTPDTRVDLNEIAIAEQRFVSGTRIDVVLAEPARMYGMRVRARNEGKNGEPRSETEFYPYAGTTAIGASNDAILSKTVPFFASATYTDAIVSLPKRAASRKQRAVRPSRGNGARTSRTGFALQNLSSSTASVSIELLDSRGFPYAVNTMSIGPDRHIVREIGEIFGIVSPPAALRVRSNVPVRALGLTIDPSTGSAAALPPR